MSSSCLTRPPYPRLVLRDELRAMRPAAFAFANARGRRCLLAVAQTGGVSAEAQEGVVYRPKLAVPETLQPFLKHLESGNDAFPAERQARELEARLLELADSLRGGPD